jgi:hypothetical protein
MEEVALEVYYIGQSIQGLLQTLVDAAIAFGISAAAGLASSETVVGGILGGAAAAYSAWVARQTWLKILDIHGKVVAAAEGLVGLLGSFLSSIEEITSTLPTSYRGVTSS